MDEFTHFMCEIAEHSGSAAGHFTCGNLHEVSTELLAMSSCLDDAKSFLISALQPHFDSATFPVKDPE